MNSQEYDALQKKQARRQILDSLKMIYPLVFSFESICAVIPAVEEGYLKKDVSYLVDKGYVEWANQRRNQPWPEREYKLTAAGVEEADRINTDPALEI